MTASTRDLRSWLIAVITALIFVLALVVLRHSLASLDLARLLAGLAAVPAEAVFASLLCCAGSYFMLTFYDWLALRGVAVDLPWRRVAPTSFMAFGIGHSVGMSSISGGSIRLREYSAAGVPDLKIAGVVALVSLGFALGVGTLLGASLLVGAEHATVVLHWTAWQVRALGAVILGLVLGYTVLTAVRRTPLRVRGRDLQLPSFGLTLAQIGVSATDLCFAAGTLYVLLPAPLPLDYAAFLGIYVLAIYAGVVSNVPGGLGVFESVLVLLLPNTRQEALFGAVLLYRAIYYLLPFVLAVALLGVRAALNHGERLRRFYERFRRRG